LVCTSQHGFLHPLTLGDEVNFRLTYDGPLKAASQSNTRRIEKHRMRLAFNQQLWPLAQADELLTRAFRYDNTEFENYRRGVMSFWPLVRASMHMVCDLDILYLRRGIPGRLISSDGDLDNRIKVLFDSLRVPADNNEVRGVERSGDPRGIICLLEDDSLITGFRVTSDQLLDAPKDAPRHYVRLIVNVEVKLTKITRENLGYLRQF
jgi:hypothetical protein